MKAKIGFGLAAIILFTAGLFTGRNLCVVPPLESELPQIGQALQVTAEAKSTYSQASVIPSDPMNRTDTAPIDSPPPPAAAPLPQSAVVAEPIKIAFTEQPAEIGQAVPLKAKTCSRSEPPLPVQSRSDAAGDEQRRVVEVAGSPHLVPPPPVKERSGPWPLVIHCTTLVSPIFEGGAIGQPVPLMVEIRKDPSFGEEAIRAAAWLPNLPAEVSKAVQSALAEAADEKSPEDRRLDQVLERLDKIERQLKRMERQKPSSRDQ
jgi:hypothetical protein